MTSRTTLVVLTMATIATSQPTFGPYAVSRTKRSNPALDGTLIDGPYHDRVQEVVVTAAIPSADHPDEKFPLLAYAHGALGGGVDIAGYVPFFDQLASYGFVIVAHKSCTLGRITASTRCFIPC